MRRARIKALATVPVRRKAIQDASVVENLQQIDKKIPEKLIENDLTVRTEYACNEVKQIEPEQLITHKVERKGTIYSIKDKDCVEFNVYDKDSKQINDGQKISKNEFQQKLPSTCIEGSPIKTMQSRLCFMRPTPRLDGGGRIRRNSVHGSGASASESEDDSKRSNIIIQNRVRNDSISSIQSLKDNGNINSIAKLNLGQKRRMVVSESARKLAEARREFLLKHENKSPDKSKLTMYDLIYYNPTSNPMKQKPVTIRPSIRKISVCSITDKKKEETEDEPSEMLVPQVKVGPNGQLIIDEQSLVIDQYKAQKNIDRSDIIIDEDTTGNGFYKRRKKSKEWNKWETVKFYKALNTYGTDFLLMQSIFPMRTRQELKLKYKKEERLNRNLVEKALQYQEFNTETLQKDLASVDESERKESAELNKINKNINLSIKKKRKRCQLLTEEINCENDDENLEYNKNTCDEESSDESSRITITKNIKKRVIRKRKTIKSQVNICTKYFKSNSDSESEIYKIQPTRSGRTFRKTSKVQKSINIFNIENIGDIEQIDDRYNNNDDEDKETNSLNRIDNSVTLNEVDSQLNEIIELQTDDETENQSELLEILGASSNISTNIFEGIVDEMPNITNLKPGSLVVLRKNNADESGKTNLQIYVVSADYDNNNPNIKDNLLPIDLSPDILETVTNCINDNEPKSIPQECNISLKTV
ncbi:PREDICTED: transcription factor TFIIIB component B'' [Ceratosolen solmsi marchali]|uniref:Transcription factor TFIIIB component B'' n=1 Tax=Ceratosolen solmsi marchali TaxID=326594 RepID=A0AAJ6YSS0_9HYME|nr:PREDICTED: transcription factor TFIIIB component B'' [Ceratosolen solmsi marchali]